MFVVVNETDYHKNVPVLLGTNIHNSIMGGMREYHGANKTARTLVLDI